MTKIEAAAEIPQRFFYRLDCSSSLISSPARRVACMGAAAAARPGPSLAHKTSYRRFISPINGRTRAHSIVREPHASASTPARGRSRPSRAAKRQDPCPPCGRNNPPSWRMLRSSYDGSCSCWFFLCCCCPVAGLSPAQFLLLLQQRFRRRNWICRSMLRALSCRRRTSPGRQSATLSRSTQTVVVTEYR